MAYICYTCAGANNIFRGTPKRDGVRPKKSIKFKLSDDSRSNNLEHAIQVILPFYFKHSGVSYLQEGGLSGPVNQTG